MDTAHYSDNLVVCEEVESTQDVARNMAGQGAAEGTAVMALRQTRGRGRTGHSWVSPSGKNLALSLILRPGLPPEEALFLTFASAVATAETLEDLGVTGATFKWPNDVLLDDRKIAGIICEGTIVDQSMELVIVGLGLNVNSVEADFPEELRGAITSILLRTGRETELETAARVFMKRMRILYDRLRDEGRARILSLWEARWAHRGALVSGPDGPGVAEGIDRDGALLIRTSDGRLTRIASGEVNPV